MPHQKYISKLMQPKVIDYFSTELAKVINSDKEKYKIDGIAVTGISGTVIGGLISVKTDLPIIIIRKEVQSHSVYKVESIFSREDNINYIFVDDLLSSGRTLRRVINEMNNAHEFSKLLKVYLYSYSKKRDTLTLKEFASSWDTLIENIKGYENIPVFRGL